MAVNDLAALIRARLMQDEIDRLQHFDHGALKALDRAVVETPMPDDLRSNIRALIYRALGEQ